MAGSTPVPRASMIRPVYTWSGSTPPSRVTLPPSRRGGSISRGGPPPFSTYRSCGTTSYSEVSIFTWMLPSEKYRGSPTGRRLCRRPSTEDCT